MHFNILHLHGVLSSPEHMQETTTRHSRPLFFTDHSELGYKVITYRISLMDPPNSASSLLSWNNICCKWRSCIETGTKGKLKYSTSSGLN